MDTYGWCNPDRAVAELREAYPDLADAFDRALVRFQDGMAAMELKGLQRRQSQPDVFRALLSDELAKIGRVEGDVEHGNRNSIVLHPHADQTVRVRVLCRPRRGGVPSAGSRTRVQEFEQGDLLADDPNIAPEIVTLTLTWRLVDGEVELALAMPVSAGGRRSGPNLAWNVNVPTEIAEVAAMEPDIDHDDDLDTIVAKPAAEAENGDDPA